MKPMNRWTLTLLAGILFLGIACDDQATKRVPEDPAPKADGADTAEEKVEVDASKDLLSEQAPAATKAPEPKVQPEVPEFIPEVINFPELYCSHVGSLELRTDITLELNMLCGNDRPTELLSSMMAEAKAMTQTGKPEVRTIRVEHHEEKELTDMIVAWAFHIPAHPFRIKALPLHSYLHPGYKRSKVEFKAKEREDYPATTDGGLHLWSVSQTYDVNIETPIGERIIQNRNTEYNVYQVLSGNDEMGLAVEHLIDEDNEFYQISNMVTASFNDGDNQAYVISFVHLLLDNQGFPESTANGLKEITQAMSELVYAGILENAHKSEPAR